MVMLHAQLTFKFFTFLRIIDPRVNWNYNINIIK